MSLPIFFILLLSLFLSGCGTEEQRLPSDEYKEEVTLSSFSLNDNYIYWEIRVGNMFHQEEDEDEVILRYDDEVLSELTPAQIKLLENADTNNGFDAYCAPGYCPVYGVALLVDSVFIIESRQDLLTFFGSIDTLAELSRWLDTNGYSLRKYENIASGYRVIAAWDNDCGTRGEDLVEVLLDGTINKIKELSSEEYNGCV